MVFISRTLEPRKIMLHLPCILFLLSVFVHCSTFKLNKCCKNPDTLPRVLYDDVYSNSPYYAVVVPRTPKTELIDNICYTYFENENGDLLNGISIVLKTGISEQYFFQVSDYDEMEGVSLSRGPGCAYLDYTLDQFCCDDVLVLYRCFVNADSCTDRETDIGMIPGRDVRIVLSTKTQLNQKCGDCLFQKLIFDDKCFLGNEFILLPNLLCPQCITEYNCKDSIRAECAKGEICVNECCRLTPLLSPNPLPDPFGPPVPPSPLFRPLNHPPPPFPFLLG